MRRALVLLALLLGCDAAGTKPAPRPSAAPTVAPAPRAFLKGQLHAHTSGSRDSETPPAEVAAWYAAHGYDFVVITDHNRVTEVASPPGMAVFRGVELTQNLRTCQPPPEPGDACLLHVNALFVAPSPQPIAFDPPASVARAELYGRAVDRALALGGVAQLNHPNFQGGADLDVVLALAKRGLVLIEIANQAIDSANEGGGRRLSTEALWDAALVRGAHVFGTATDDAHHYADADRVRAQGGVAYTGDRGFVMVRAVNQEAAIRAAIAGGDFYASTGVILDRLELRVDSVVIEPRPERPPFTFEVIAGGRVVERTQGAALRFDPREARAGRIDYLRVRVTDAAGRQAWTQPSWS